MQRHELAQLALDCALHRLPEPDLPWRTNIPAEPFLFGAAGRGYLGSGRSPNIETMTVAAWIGFIANGHVSKKQREPALRMAADLLLANQRCFLLNEFGSTIYSGWTVTAWAALVTFLYKMGEATLSAGFRELLTQWLALARAALAPCPADGLHLEVHYVGKGGKDEVLDEGRQAGRWVVVLCGERSWGHGHGLGHGHHALARVAFGLEKPRPKGGLPDPGRVDGWMERAQGLLAPLLRECALPSAVRYAAGDWAGLVALLVYPAAQPCELRCYADGARVFVEGGDEPEPKDEDDNSNTPRLALMAVYQTPPKILSLPAWPAPNGGDTRIRQTGVWSDIDRDATGLGWVLLHSHVGVTRLGDRWLSKAPDPAALLVARIACYGAGDGWALTGPREALPADPPSSPANPGAILEAKRGARPRRRRSWWRRLLGLD